MTTGNIKKPITIFPDIPRDVPLVDNKGMLTDAWKFIFDQAFTALQTNLKPEGFVIPQETTANINKLIGTQSFTNEIYDTTVDSFKGNAKYPNPDGSKTQVWMPFAMITNFAGNPNGNVPGSLYWFCWDTSDSELWICTTAGNAANAVWTSCCCSMDAMLLL